MSLIFQILFRLFSFQFSFNRINIFLQTMFHKVFCLLYNKSGLERLTIQSIPVQYQSILNPSKWAKVFPPPNRLVPLFFVNLPYLIILPSFLFTSLCHFQVDTFSLDWYIKIIYYSLYFLPFLRHKYHQWLRTPQTFITPLILRLPVFMNFHWS